MIKIIVFILIIVLLYLFIKDDGKFKFKRGNKLDYYSLTAVSGYWIIKNKHGNTNFKKWFKNTLSLNCPYVFFGNKDTINMAKEYRGNLPTIYVNIHIEDFYTYKYKDFIQTHPVHCPSKELNMIWHEKIYLVNKVADINPFNTDHFAWIDAGICSFRNRPPPKDIFPNSNFNLLPKNKMICCPTDSHIYNKKRAEDDNDYYHYIFGNYIIPKCILKKLVHLYSSYLDYYMKKKDWKCIDQVIWTKIYRDNPELFHIIGKTYGDVHYYLS